jgi:hypothetical protein
MQRPNFVPPEPPLVRESYAANYLYWHVYQPQPWPWASREQGWARGLYEDPGVWETYRSLLLDIAKFTNEQNIAFIVVIFPDLQNIKDSRPIVTRIANLYAGQNVPVLNVTTLIQGQNPQTLMVNSVDWHPNEKLHELVAEALYQLVQTTSQVQK